MAAIRGFSLANISKIRVAFSTFDSRVASARDFLRRVSSSKLRETNPKCKITSVISCDYSAPTVDVTFSDGSSVHFNTTETNVLEMIAEINTKARTL